MPPDLDLLRKLAKVGDPICDELVAGMSAPDPGTLYKNLVADIAGDPGEGNDWISTWFTVRPTWPDWVDPELLAVGQALYRERMWSLNVAFMLSSLPMSYCGANGAEVLVRTGRMVEDTQRRIFETALLMMEVAEPGGLHDGADGRPAGHGYLTVLRLRLLHAAARTALVDLGMDARQGREASPWDIDAAGVPVSQLDLLGTTWCFALSSLRALELAEHFLSEEQRRGWVHLWCLVGHLLGLDAADVAEHLPMEPADAEQCFAAVRDLQFTESPAGGRLAHELVKVGHLRIPFKAADHLVEALIYRNLGPTYARMVGIAPIDDPALVRRAEWFWHLTLSDRPPRDGLEPKRLGRWRVKRFLLRQVACQLKDGERDLRSPSAVESLMRTYEVGPVARQKARRERRKLTP